MFQLGLFHQQLIRGAFVTLDLLFLNLLHQSFLFGLQKVQLLQCKGSTHIKQRKCMQQLHRVINNDTLRLRSKVWCDGNDGHVYLLVVDELLANLAGIDSVQTAAAFG